ncbi:MAG: GWxTD domain-containing protein [Bacteroidota bacterium]|nr:GWxTD domain-containing protein [Bacteroidota bacterium]
MTSNTRNVVSCVVCYMLMFATLSFGQERGLAMGEGMQLQGALQHLVGFEPHFIAGDSSATRVDISFRVRYDFFIFTHPFGTASNRFTANGEIGIEVLDTNDTPAARDIETIHLQSETSSAASLKDDYYQGSATFSLHPGKYKLVYHVDDKQSERNFRDDRHMLFVPSFKQRNAGRSSAIFVEQVPQPASTSTFTLLNLGNGTELGKNTGMILSLAQKDSAPTLHYEIIPVGGEENPSIRFSMTREERNVEHPHREELQLANERSPAQNDTTLGTVFFPQTDISIAEVRSRSVSYRLVPHNGTKWAYGVLRTEQLLQGRYLLKIYFDGNDAAIMRQPFTVEWLDMPMSLTNLDFAVKAMQYITTDSEYDRLQSGSLTERIKAFEAFWKQRDPTPATAYNEMMAEYFRRVDYTETAFRTLKEDNGAMTDRGKVYILNGAPSNIERLLQPNSVPKEVWTYESLKKKFYFEDQSRQGNYKLVLVENLAGEQQ